MALHPVRTMQSHAFTLSTSRFVSNFAVWFIFVTFLLVYAAASLSEAGLQRSSPQSPLSSVDHSKGSASMDGMPSSAAVAPAASPTSPPATSAPAASAWSKGGPSFASLFSNVQPKSPPASSSVPPYSVNFPSRPAAPAGLLDDEPVKMVSVDEDSMAKDIGGE